MKVFIKGDINTCAKVACVGLPINVTCLVKREIQENGSGASLYDRSVIIGASGYGMFLELTFGYDWATKDTEATNAWFL